MMLPFWATDNAQIYCGDCLQIIPVIGAVDHIISDPPYEQVLHNATGKINRIRNDGVRIAEEFGFEGIDAIRDEVAFKCVAASAGWVLLFALAEGVAAWRDALQAANAKYDTCLAWIKPDAMPRFNGQGAARGFECCVTAWAGKGYRSWNGGGKKGIYYHGRNPEEKTGHPTQKPLSLMMELIQDFTNPGQLILDPFMGSGTTGEAALRMGRRFIGIEQQEKFCAIAAQRMQRVIDQPNLFTGHQTRPKQGDLLT